MPYQPVIDRNALLARAEQLGWPTVGVEGFGIGTEAQWRRAVGRIFPVELENLARQLDRIEAERPVRTEPASAFDPVPMLDDEEMRQVEAEREERAAHAEAEYQRRLRESEERRLERERIR